jgi:sugar phosphate isomerase/epimerase
MCKMNSMSKWPIGLSTGCFYASSILDVLDPIREAGFRTLEICSFPKHLDYHDASFVARAAERLRSLDLNPFSMHAPFAEHIDITSLDAGARDRAVEEIARATEAAAVLGVRHLVIHPGPEREGSPPSEERYRRLENAAASLTRINVHCGTLGVTLLLENMLPHLLFGHISDMLFILGAIDAVNVGACLDTGHAHLSGELTTVARKLCSHLQMVHANDNRGDRDSHLPPGEGTIDWDVVTHELRACDFGGTIILELAGGGDTQEVLDRAHRGRRLLEERS